MKGTKLDFMIYGASNMGQKQEFPKFEANSIYRGRIRICCLICQQTFDNEFDHMYKSSVQHPSMINSGTKLTKIWPFKNWQENQILLIFCANSMIWCQIQIWSAKCRQLLTVILNSTTSGKHYIWKLKGTKRDFMIYGASNTGQKQDFPKFDAYSIYRGRIRICCFICRQLLTTISITCISQVSNTKVWSTAEQNLTKYGPSKIDEKSEFADISSELNNSMPNSNMIRKVPTTFNSNFE